MSEDIQWRARVFSDKILKAEVQKEIYKLALVLLGNHQLKVEHKKEGFDRYPYCKHTTKQWCPVGSRTMHYMGRWREYVVFGHTRTDVYLEVLKLLANDNSTYFPVVSYRKDNDWVERKDFEELQEENNLMKQYVKNGLEMGYIHDHEKDYEKFLGGNE
jgi:hypothetical protein